MNPLISQTEPATFLPADKTTALMPNAWKGFGDAVPYFDIPGVEEISESPFASSKKKLLYASVE